MTTEFNIASILADETLFSVVSAKRAMNGYESRLDDLGDLLCKFRFANRYTFCLSINSMCRGNTPVRLTVFDAAKKEEMIIGTFELISRGQMAFVAAITQLLQEEKDLSSNHSPRFVLFGTAQTTKKTKNNGTK